MSPNRNRAWLVALLIAGPVACSEAAQQSETSGAGGVVAIADGEALYRTNCTPCHGEAGLGDGPLASSLPVRPANIVEHLGNHPHEDMVRLIREGIPPSMPPAVISESEVREVLSYFCNADIDSAESLLAADLRFSGPFHQFDSRRAYIESLKRNPPEKCAFKVRSVTENENEVCVFYDYVKRKQSITIAQLCKFEDRKISEIVLVFDGRGSI